MSKKPTIQNTIAFPVELYEKLKLVAEKEHRSIGQQIIKICEIFVEQYEKP